jgi:hypothetical protein
MFSQLVYPNYTYSCRTVEEGRHMLLRVCSYSLAFLLQSSDSKDSHQARQGTQQILSLPSTTTVCEIEPLDRSQSQAVVQCVGLSARVFISLWPWILNDVCAVSFFEARWRPTFLYRASVVCRQTHGQSFVLYFFSVFFEKSTAATRELWSSSLGVAAKGDANARSPLSVHLPSQYMF